MCQFPSLFLSFSLSLSLSLAHAHTDTQIHTHTHTRTHINKHTHKHTQTHTQTHIHKRKNIDYKQTNKRTQTHKHTHTYKLIHIYSLSLKKKIFISFYLSLCIEGMQITSVLNPCDFIFLSYLISSKEYIREDSSRRISLTSTLF